MKIIIGLVLSVVALAFAPMPQFPPPCYNCSTAAVGWNAPPEDCRSVTDNLSCTPATSYCTISGTLTVDQTCSGDECLRYYSAIGDCSTPPSYNLLSAE